MFVYEETQGVEVEVEVPKQKVESLQPVAMWNVQIVTMLGWKQHVFGSLKVPTHSSLHHVCPTPLSSHHSRLALSPPFSNAQ